MITPVSPATLPCYQLRGLIVVCEDLSRVGKGESERENWRERVAPGIKSIMNKLVSIALIVAEIGCGPPDDRRL